VAFGTGAVGFLPKMPPCLFNTKITGSTGFFLAGGGADLVFFFFLFCFLVGCLLFDLPLSSVADAEGLRECPTAFPLERFGSDSLSLLLLLSSLSLLDESEDEDEEELLLLDDEEEEDEEDESARLRPAAATGAAAGDCGLVGTTLQFPAGTFDVIVVEAAALSSGGLHSASTQYTPSIFCCDMYARRREATVKLFLLFRREGNVRDLALLFARRSRIAAIRRGVCRPPPAAAAAAAAASAAAPAPLALAGDTSCGGLRTTRAT